MKIAFRLEQMASFFIYNGLARAFDKLGYKVFFWDNTKNSAFDFFNDVEPDIYFGQGYNLCRAEIKCIKNRPEMKVLLKVGIDGNINSEFDHTKYEALFTSEEEKKNVGELQNHPYLFLFNYGRPKYQDLLIGNWKSVAKTFMLTLAGDKYAFFPDYRENLQSDIVFCGGYWQYKSKNLNPYIINNFCYPVGKYKIKIFGNQVWPVPQYGGIISDNTIRQIISSSKITPAVHEPHANRYGYEEESRVYNAMLCKSLVLCDRVDSYKEAFGDTLPIFNDEHCYKDCIDYYLKNEDKRLELIEKQYNIAINNETYDNRVKDILEVINEH